MTTAVPVSSDCTTPEKYPAIPTIANLATRSPGTTCANSVPAPTPTASDGAKAIRVSRSGHCGARDPGDGADVEGAPHPTWLVAA